MKANLNSPDIKALIAKRRDEIIAKQLPDIIERIAAKQAAEVIRSLGDVAPSRPHRHRRHAVMYGPGTVLERGNGDSMQRFRYGGVASNIAKVIWNSLGPRGKFSGRATRKDISEYIESFDEFKDVKHAVVSGVISNMLKRGVLVPAAID